MTADRLDGLTTVVINYGLPDLTVRCVHALAGDGVRPERIVIVDNGSTDDSVERLRATFPECPFVALDENVGYARAANAGAAALDGTNYLIMNNDAFVHRPGSVAALVDALEADPERGIVVPRVRNDDLTLQRTVKPLDTPAVALVRASGLSRFVPNRFQPRWSTHWNHDRSREIVAADGPVLAVRGSAWNALGGYNPRIRMYAEDTDMCWRVRKLGWTTWFTVDAEFVHLGRATSDRHWTNPARATLVGRSEAALLHEQLGPLAARSAILFIVGGLGARWALMRLRRDRESAEAIRAAIAAYAAGIGSGDVNGGSRVA